MGLLLKDKLELSTPLGSQEIQLLIGDITKLPLEEKVDVLFISAFHGSYVPIRSTLIGSLAQNLGIIVKDLARQKELDLWKNFSCWVSAPLPASVPFRQIVCFEYNQRVGTLVEQLSQMFLAMMPIFNNTESTVITPLLASGNQGHSGVVVLRAMVDGACHWIQAGLPLHCLKIVVFSENPGKLRKSDKMYLKRFSELKDKWSQKLNKAEKKSQPYDICLSFSPAEQELAERVSAILRRQAAGIRIHSNPFKVDHSLVWQTDIFNVMKKSKKLKKAEVVIPFHLKTVASLPSYMGIVQYVECSQSADEETTKAVLESACSDVIKSLKLSTCVQDDGPDQLDLKTLELSHNTTYDVFISYSHRHKSEPEELAHTFRTRFAHLNVFLDQKELKAGNIWQQAVYEAADKARCIVAFLTPGYLQSSVCNEEFNIALARQYAHDTILLVPVVTDISQPVPRRLTSVPYVHLGNGQESTIEFAAKIVELLTENKSSVTTPDEAIMKQMMAYKRKTDFVDQFYLDGNGVVRKTPQRFLGRLEGVIVFSYAQDCLKLAAILSAILKRYSPKLLCQLKAVSHSRQRRQQLDTADVIIYFVSDLFVSTQNLVEELHTGLCRQRMVKDSTIVYFIQYNHKLPTPFYFQALPFSVSMDDHLWQTMEDSVVKDKISYHVDIPGMEGIYKCTDAHSCALTVASYHILSLLSQRGKGSQIVHSLVNIMQIENTAAGVDDAVVSAKEFVVPITSISHTMPKQHSHIDLSAPAGGHNQQQQTFTGEKTGTRQQKTQDSRNDYNIWNQSGDEVQHQQSLDLQRESRVAHKQTSGQMVELGVRASSQQQKPNNTDNDYQDVTVPYQNPQMMKLTQDPTIKAPEQDGKQRNTRKQKVQCITCCVL